MLQKYLIVIVVCVSAVINVIGQNDHRNNFKNFENNKMALWKAEIEESLTDKVIEKLDNKLTDILEQRLVLNFEKLLQEKLVNKLELKLAKKIEETLEEKIEIKLEKVLADKLESKLEGKLESKLESSLSAKLALTLEEKLEVNLESKVAEIVEEKLTNKLEPKLEEKLEQKLEKKLEYKLENTLEVQLENKLGESLEKKFEEKFAGHLEEKLTGKFEATLSLKLEANLDKKLTETLQVEFRDKLDNKLKDIGNTYRCNEQGRGSQKVEWVKTTAEEAVSSLKDRAVVAGYEPDGYPLWVMRVLFKNDLVPGKLMVEKQFSAISWDGHEYYFSDEIEVFCAPQERVRWIENRNGVVPSCAVEAGKTQTGDILYIGRAKQLDSLTPGKVHPRYKSLFMPYNSKEVIHNVYEVLCIV